VEQIRGYTTIELTPTLASEGRSDRDFG
jgi:hypothetical protein